MFENAESEAAIRPVVLFIDEIDAMCAKRDSGKRWLLSYCRCVESHNTHSTCTVFVLIFTSHENRVVAQLLTLMDGMLTR